MDVTYPYSFGMLTVRDIVACSFRIGLKYHDCVVIETTIDEFGV